ncbi:DUF3280 domain-containing protein [Roseicella sp. DB1501]|uniref:DUF3280 domain-containing protein n=1 Tax=Roseicella sp. DB1501 TaxID=2730925 RepID=UPI001490F5E4|nr:DUF3280 domain-containing protein [Roseicella sp. DB1501]NOG73111.1 DUF3280 domain-containing protein [Roseicella sp. DB1501]
MRPTRRAAWLPLLLLLAPPARAGESIVVFDPELRDTSGEGERPDQQQRLGMIGALLRQGLAESGRYSLVDPAPQRARLAQGPALGSCGACAAEAARALGAQLALVTVVHKVSNLILYFSITMLDAASEAERAVWRADIRGNTDESWRHGIAWMLRHRILAEPGPGR